MLKWLISCASIALSIGCTTQEKDHNKNEYFVMESKTIIEGLKQNNFKQIDEATFNEKCLKYFGVNIADTDETTLTVGRNGYVIFRQEACLSATTESVFLNPDATKDMFTEMEVLAQFQSNKNPIIQKIIAYNKLLFNDEPNASHYFMKNLDDANEVVIDFNYEQNTIITNYVINNLDVENVDFETIQNMLFNPSGKFRLEFNQKITNKRNKEFLFDYATRMAEFWEETPNFKDKITATLFFLNELDYPEKVVSIHEKYNLSLLEMLDLKDDKIVNMLIAQKSLEPKIRQLINDYKSLKEMNDETPIWGQISDTDGYVNIRKSDDPKSAIIEKINDGEKVEVFPTEKNMWLIKNHAGKTGYVHKSRLKMFY